MVQEKKQCTNESRGRIHHNPSQLNLRCRFKSDGRWRRVRLELGSCAGKCTGEFLPVRERDTGGFPVQVLKGEALGQSESVSARRTVGLLESLRRRSP